jgi:ubiquinone/menaquinone biosynthesis C-methylase UbiE
LSSDKVSFDDYVQTYKKEVQDSIDFIGQDADFFIELKAKVLIKIAEKNFDSLNNIKVLDIGCGVGLTDRHLTSEIKNLYGVDVSSGAVENANKRNPNVKYTDYEGERLPFEDNFFDLAFAINVMHHVEPAKWENFVSEMKRVIKPGGIMVVFEHNPLNPLTRRAVNHCEFDRDAVLLGSGKLKSLFDTADVKISESGYIIFFPFKSKFFRSVENVLGWLPFGAQHFIVGKK